MNPLLTLAVLLGIAFMMPLLEKAGRNVARTFFLAGLGFLFIYSGMMAFELISGAPAIEVATGGFEPPLSINFRVGISEGIIWSASALVLLVGGFYMIRREADGMYDRMLYLIFALGVTGLILTRDLFNVFVFLELTSLGVYGLIGRGGGKSLQAGFKYMIAGGMASIMFLIGTVFIYRYTGTLNIDHMVAIVSSGGVNGPAMASAILFLTLAFLIELKPFPANGWALDAYQAAPSGVGALLSSAQAAAVFIAFSKIGPLLGDSLMSVVGGIGLSTFFFSNLMGMRQKDEKRMFGYSSTGQVGLAVFAWTMSTRMNVPEAVSLLIVGGFLLTHMFAKAGLFWLTGNLPRDGQNSDKPLLSGFLPAAIAGLFVMALLALPPFPAFYAKWELVKLLVGSGSWLSLIALFLGSIFEAVYLFGWLIRRTKLQPADGGADMANGDSLVVGRRIGPEILTDADVISLSADEKPAGLGTSSWGFVSALVLLGMAAGWTYLSGMLTPVVMAPFAAVLLMFVLAFLPGRIRGALAVVISVVAAWWIWPRTEGLDRIFAMLFLVGGAINLFAGMYRKDRRIGYWAFSLMTILSLGSLVLAESAIAIFIAWETMSVGMVLIVLQGKRAAGPARSGILFALGGGYLLMTVLISGVVGPVFGPGVAVILVGLAFLAKSGSMGLHIWLPGSYAEADDDASSLLSSVIGKAAIWGMMIFTLRVLPPMYGLDNPEVFIAAFNSGGFRILADLLGWAGAFTALAATLIAVFQEDIKYTLAWSSIGQIGYIVLAFSLFDHFGWTTAIYLSINHFIFKSLLFLGMAGVIMRVKTRLMYKMGGLIKPMPITYISVLMAIIALSGVPPLAGFGGKWLIYSSLIEGGRVLQAATVMFASGIAFLYLFRLIHVVFLGQRKDSSVGIKEAPFWLILPQILLIAVLMAISSFPSIILQPIIDAVGQWMPARIGFEGSTLMSALGYWNGSWVMYVTMGVFMLPLIILLIGMRNPRRVKQFNIVFAAERPHRPETTHYGHNFYAPVRKALGFLLKPFGRKFWEGTSVGVNAVASSFRRLYTGNGQTYALHIVLFAMAVALFAGVFA